MFVVVHFNPTSINFKSFTVLFILFTKRNLSNYEKKEHHDLRLQEEVKRKKEENNQTITQKKAEIKQKRA